MLWVLLVWTAAGYPLRPLIPVSWGTQRGLNQPRHTPLVNEHPPQREVIVLKSWDGPLAAL